MVGDVEYAPEEPILDASVPGVSGYLQSKWVAERYVQSASERRLLDTNVIRVGLLSGAHDGGWDSGQWFPGLVQSSLEIGCLPDGDAVGTTLSRIPSSE